MHDLERIAERRGMQRDQVLAFRHAPDKYLALFAAFVERNARTGQKLRDCLATRDLAGARALAHSLAGEAAVLGATAVRQGAVAVEEGVRLATATESLDDVLVDVEELESALAALARPETDASAG